MLRPASREAGKEGANRRFGGHHTGLCPCPDLSQRMHQISHFEGARVETSMKESQREGLWSLRLGSARRKGQSRHLSPCPGFRLVI